MSFLIYLFCSGDLAKAIRNNTDIHFGLYHSLFEWFNPLFNQDEANKYKTRNFVTVRKKSIEYSILHNLFVKLMIKELQELIAHRGIIIYLYVMDYHQDQLILKGTRKKKL